MELAPATKPLPTLPTATVLGFSGLGRMLGGNSSFTVAASVFFTSLQTGSDAGSIIPSKYGHGGVLGGSEASLCPVRSRWRGTFSPSNFTSMDQAQKLALPLIWLVTTPFFGALPASSPVLVLKQDLFFSMTSLPEIMTVLLPSVVSLAMAVLG